MTKAISSLNGTPGYLVGFFGLLIFVVSMFLCGQQVRSLTAEPVLVSGQASPAERPSVITLPGCAEMTFDPCADLDTSTIDYAPGYIPVAKP